MLLIVICEKREKKSYQKDIYPPGMRKKIIEELRLTNL